MAFPIKEFFGRLEITEDVEAILLRRCDAAGLEEVIDLSLLEPDQIPAVLGTDAEAHGSGW